MSEVPLQGLGPRLTPPVVRGLSRAERHFRAKREQLKRVWGLLPESQGLDYLTRAVFARQRAGAESWVGWCWGRIGARVRVGGSTAAARAAGPARARRFLPSWTSVSTRVCSAALSLSSCAWCIVKSSRSRSSFISRRLKFTVRRHKINTDSLSPVHPRLQRRLVIKALL